MKKTNASKRLLLSVERIRDLQPSQLAGVVGGAYCTVTAGDSCDVTGGCGATAGGGGGGGGGTQNCGCDTYGGATACKGTNGSCALTAAG